MRFQVLALTVFLAVGACSQPPASSAARSGDRAGSYRVWVPSGNGEIQMVDSGSGAVLQTLPAGAPAPDWSVIYQALPAVDHTLVKAIDSHTGVSLRSLSVPGTYQVAGLSPNGRWLALSSKDQTTS